MRARWRGIHLDHVPEMDRRFAGEFDSIGRRATNLIHQNQVDRCARLDEHGPAAVEGKAGGLERFRELFARFGHEHIHVHRSSNVPVQGHKNAPADAFLTQDG